MGESLGRAELELATNQSQLDAGMKQAETKSLGFLGRVKDSFSRLSGSTMGGAILQGVGLGAGLSAFGAIQAGIGKTVQFFGDAITAASDLAETTSKVGVVFGEQSDKIMDLGETSAEALGMSKNAALAAAGTYGNLFRAMGITEEASADMSVGLVQLAADLASFNNMEPDVVLDKLRAGLSGETEPLRTLGVNLNQARIQAKAMEMGLVDATGQLSAAAKAQATYALILEDTSLAQGDFARTSDGLANTQRIISAQLEDVSAEIGTALLPAWLALMSLFRDVGVPAIKLLADVAGVMGAALSETGEVVNFLKPGLIALGVVITGALIPAFIGWAAAAVPAAAAVVVAFAPVIVALAAVTAAVVALSAITNTFAMDFGDMGDRLHEIADGTGASYDEVKDYVKQAMAESGLSFEEAADAAAEHFGSMKDSAVTNTEDMVAETKAHQRDMLESTRTTGDAIEDEYADTYRHTLQDTRDWATEMLAIFKEQEDPVRQAGATAADAYTAEIQTMHKISATEAELASKDLREKLASQDPQIRADAEARRASLVAELITLKNEYATQGDATAQLARTKALLTGQFMADGLNAKDPEVRAAFVGWKTELELRMGQLEGSAFSGGTAVTAEFARGIRLTQWTMATALQNAVQLARNQFPGSEPKDPQSPLRGITKAFGFWDVFTGGLRQGEGSFAGALQSAARRARGALDVGPMAAPAFAMAGPGMGSLASVQRLSEQGEVHIHYELTVDGLRKEVGSREEALDELRRMSVWER